MRSQDYAAICIADLPPSPSSKTRYLVKRLRAALPDVRIVVGRWAHATLADDVAQPLLDAGASHAARSLAETRKHLADGAAAAIPDVVVPVAAASSGGPEGPPYGHTIISVLRGTRRRPRRKRSRTRAAGAGRRRPNRGAR